MAIVKPFQAVRPDKEYVQRIAALPYDVYNREEARVVVGENPMSFLAIDRAETLFPREADIYGNWVYEKAGDLLKEWTEKGYFVLAITNEPGWTLYVDDIEIEKETFGEAFIATYLESVLNLTLPPLVSRARFQKVVDILAASASGIL